MSSIEIIEKFYGESLTPGLIQTISKTPDEQLEVLISLLVFEDRGNPPNYAAIRSATLVEGLLLPSPATATRLASSDLLRRMLVYLDPLVVVDPGALWAESLRFPLGLGLGFTPSDSSRPLGGGLARCLQGLLPLLPLIRTGAITLVHAPRVSWRGTTTASTNITTRRMINNSFTGRFGHLLPVQYRSMKDEYSLSHARDLLEAMSQVFNPAFTFNELGRQLFAPDLPETAFEDHHWLGPLGARLQQVLAFTEFAAANDCVRAATSSDMVTFSNRENLAAAQLDSSTSWMCSLPVPLISADIAELVALRLGEDSFAEFRTALMTVLSRASADVESLDYESAMNRVSDISAQVMPDAINRLEAISRRSALLGRWLPKGVTIGVKAGVRALTAGVGEFAATPTAGAAGTITSALTKGNRTEGDSAAVARRLALSLTIGGTPPTGTDEI